MPLGATGLACVLPASLPFRKTPCVAAIVALMSWGISLKFYSYACAIRWSRWLSVRACSALWDRCQLAAGVIEIRV